MLETKPRIADIQTTGLLYFDPDHAEECYEFCRDREIDCLPDLEDPTYFYRRNDHTKTFERLAMGQERQIRAGAYIFHPDLLSCFRQQPLRFVFDGDDLSGVVHFSDYNKKAVSTYLYAVFHDYERHLRTFMTCKELKNESMRNYFAEKVEKREKGYQKKLNWYDNNKEAIERAQPFQLFYLKDLIGLLCLQGILELAPEVNKLRNMIMHNHELVAVTSVSTPDYIYDVSSFEKFFAWALLLLRDARRVANRIAFMRGEHQIPAWYLE